MAATLRISCKHDAPAGASWLNELNQQGRRPVVEIDGVKHPLRWDEPTNVLVAAEEPHRLHAYFEVLGVLRWGGADLELPSAPEGGSQSVEYLVTLKDRYLNTAHFRQVG